MFGRVMSGRRLTVFGGGVYKRNRDEDDGAWDYLRGVKQQVNMCRECGSFYGYDSGWTCQVCRLPTCRFCGQDNVVLARDMVSRADESGWRVPSSFRVHSCKFCQSVVWSEMVRDNTFSYGGHRRELFENRRRDFENGSRSDYNNNNSSGSRNRWYYDDGRGAD